METGSVLQQFLQGRQILKPAVQRAGGFVTSVLPSPLFHSPLSVIAPSPDCRSPPGQDQLSDHRAGCCKLGPDYHTQLQE